MPGSVKLTPEELDVYRTTMRQRRDGEQRERHRRRERAREVARQAEVLLKEKFGATRVVVFGSLAHNYWFSRTSDVDIAAWGMKEEDYFIAVARLQDLSPDFNVDLVDMEHCKPGLRDEIMKVRESL